MVGRYLRRKNHVISVAGVFVIEAVTSTVVNERVDK